MAKKNAQVVFLDRDGVINKFPGNGKYVTKVRDFHFIPRSLEAIKKLSDAGCEIFVISNQAGVGKNVFTQNKLDRITHKLLEGIKKSKAKIRRVYYCTHRSDEGCDCRKPEIGNIEKSYKVLKRPLSQAKDAYFVGDTVGDIQAGINAGCKTILALSGRENMNHMRNKQVKPDYVVEDLFEAVEVILNENSSDSRQRRRRS